MISRARLTTLGAFSLLVLLSACGDMGGAPRGTVENNATTRAIDRAAGTDKSTEYPLNADGMPGNPSGTAVSRGINKIVK